MQGLGGAQTVNVGRGAAEGARIVSSQMEFWNLLAYAGDIGPVEERGLHGCRLNRSGQQPCA